MPRAFALVPAWALLSACGAIGTTAAPSTEKSVRLGLGDGAQFEMRLPNGWSHTPTTEFTPSGPRLGMVRLSSLPGELPQLRLLPRQEPTPRSTPSAEQLLQRAQRELAASAECTAINPTVQQRKLSQGVAVFCSRSAPGVRAAGLTPITAGVLATPELTVRFAVLDGSDEVAQANWSILDSLRVLSFRLGP